MERINVTQAVRKFSDLLNRVFYQGTSFELERGNRVIARICPVSQESQIKVRDLNRFFAKLPTLGKDTASFSEDLVKAKKMIPAEKSQWD